MEETGTGSSDEQIPEEGGASEEEEITDVIPSDEEEGETPSEEAVDEPVAEEPTEDVDPTTDPAEDEMTLDGAEIDAAGDTYSLTITDYTKLKSQVNFSAAVGGTPTSISQKGVITAKEPEQGTTKPAITLTITAKPNWQITEVKKDGADTGVTEASGTYTVSTDTTATVTVATVATYSVKVTGAGGTGIKVTTSDAADAATTDIAVAGTTVLKKDRDLVFEVAGSTAVEGTSRLKVYYIADGSDGDDPIEITPETTGTAPNTKTTYTVKKDIIDSLDESIEIKLVAEEKVAVTVDKTGSKVTDIEVEVPKTGSTTGEKEWVAYDAETTPNNKVFAGESFKFRVKTAANYTIKKALLDDETELTAGTAMTVGSGDTAVTWIPYEVTPQKAATVTFETEFDSTKKSTLTFTLTGNTGSATAKITGVIPVEKEEETATDAEIATALGITAAQLDLASGKSLDILKPTGEGATVEVTVTAKPGYALKKTSTEETAPKTRKYTFTGTTLTAELSVEAETEAAETEDARYFKITTADGDNIKNITVDAPAGGKVTKKGTDNESYYEVAAGAQTVKFTVDVKEGYKLAAISEAYSDPKEVSTTNGFTKYEVLLQANKITSKTDAFANATDIALTKAAITYTVSESEDCSAAGYSATYEIKDNADEEADFDSINIAEDSVGYNHALKATITPADNYSLEEVSYTMGGAPVPVAIEYDDSDQQVAKLNIAKVTDNVEVTIKTKNSVELGVLREVVVEDGTTSFEEVKDRDADEIYQVNYKGKYVVDVLDAGEPVAAKDISVVVKDASGTAVAMTTPLVTSTTGATKRSFNLASKDLAGQEITAEVSYKGALIGTYIMQVNKKTTELSINGGEAIEQSVDSVKYYSIATNGATPEDADITVTNAEGGKDLARLITAKIANNQLKVTIDPASHSQIATKATTGSDETETTTWTPWKATIKVASPDDADIFDEVEISLTPLFDEDAAPTVSLVDAANNVLNVKVDMADVAVPNAGSVWYEVTATAKAGVAEEGQQAPVRPSELLESVTKIVKTTDNRVALVVAPGKQLGEETPAWEAGYDVTAKLVYVEDKEEPAKGATAGNDAVAVSKEGKLEGAATKAPLFEDALKLKKAPGAPAKLYTGQTDEIVIAVPQWSKKFNSYQILSDNVSDNYYYDYDGDDYEHYENPGLPVGVNADGNIVVKGVPAKAQLGKHTITVVATADETGKNNEYGYLQHTTYASRATITVNVVKGINEITVTQPSDSIYKDPKKAGTLKLGVTYNNGDYGSYSGSKYITAPATKKVKWSIVDATSSLSTIKEAPAYLKVGDTKNGVNVKNGTVTVAQKFTLDERHANNNRFKVLVEADDFAGNTTKELSDVIYITSEALDVTNLVIAKRDDVNGGYNVIAVKEGTKSAKAVDVKAQDIEGAYVYATAKTVATGFVSRTQWNSLGMVSDNLTYGPAKGNLIVNSRGYISTAVPGKKATITVTTTDGSKKKNSIALNMGYTDADSTAALGITAYAADDWAKEVAVTKAPTKEADAEAKVEKDYTLPGVARLSVSVYVAQRDDKGTFKNFVTANKYQNYKLTVKGGKVVSNSDGYATVYTTSKVTTLNLTVGAGKAAKKYTYVLTNLAYNETVKPKVTVKNTLHTYGSVDEQKVTMVALNGKESFGDNKYAKVELDKTAMPKYGTTQYDAWSTFNYLLKSNYIKLNKDNGEFVLEFNDNAYGHDYLGNEIPKVSLTAGTYKLKVTVGEGDTASKFVAKTQPVNVTVKVVANKAFTFKPTTSYTINKVDGGAVLTGKANLNAKAGELLGMNFYDLQNVNLKGKSNKFTHYFMIATDEKTGTQRLTLNTEDDLVKAMIYEPQKNDDGTDKTDANGKVLLSSTLKENPVINIPKEDLTGYITYFARPSVNYYSNYASGTVKITVKIAPEAKAGKPAKASQKYATNRAEVALESGKSTEMNVIVNGSYVSIAYALVDDTKKGNAEELAVDLAGNAKGQIVLKTTKAVEEGKTYSTNLLIVPTSSYYSKVIDGAPAATAAKEGEAATVPTKQDLIKKYGIAVKVSVLASKNPAKTPDPTGAEKETAEDATPEEIAALKSKAEAVKITKDQYEAPAADAEAGTKGTLIGEDDIKTNIKNAIWSVTGWVAAEITVGDISVTKNPTTTETGTATVATINVQRGGYNLVTLENVVLEIEKLDPTTQTPDPDDSDDNT